GGPEREQLALADGRDEQGRAREGDVGRRGAHLVNRHLIPLPGRGDLDDVAGAAVQRRRGAAGGEEEVAGRIDGDPGARQERVRCREGRGGQEPGVRRAQVVREVERRVLELGGERQGDDVDIDALHERHAGGKPGHEHLDVGRLDLPRDVAEQDDAGRAAVGGRGRGRRQRARQVGERALLDVVDRIGGDLRRAGPRAARLQARPQRGRRRLVEVVIEDGSIREKAYHVAGAQRVGIARRHDRLEEVRARRLGREDVLVQEVAGRVVHLEQRLLAV